MTKSLIIPSPPLEGPGSVSAVDPENVINRSRTIVREHTSIIARVDKLLKEFNVHLLLDGLTDFQLASLSVTGQCDSALIGRIIRLGSLVVYTGRFDPCNYPWLLPNKGRSYYCKTLRRQLYELSGCCPFTRSGLKRPIDKATLLDQEWREATNRFSLLLRFNEDIEDEERLDAVAPVPVIPIEDIRRERVIETNKTRLALGYPPKPVPQGSSNPVAAEHLDVRRRQRVALREILKNLREPDALNLLVSEARVERCDEEGLLVGLPSLFSRLERGEG